MSGSRYGGMTGGKKTLLENWENRKSPSTNQNAPETIDQFDYVTAQGIWNLRSTNQFPKWQGPRKISHTTAASNGSTTVSSLNITLPTGILANDVIFIICGNDDATATAQWTTTTKPTGFTFIAHYGDANPDAHIGAFYKVAAGTESGTTVTVPAATAANMWAVAITVKYANTASLIDTIGSATLVASAQTHTIPAITTSVSNTLVFYCLASDGSDLAPYTDPTGGWVEITEIGAGVSGTSAGGVVGYIRKRDAGDTGTVSITFGGGSDGASAFMFSIKGLA